MRNSLNVTINEKQKINKKIYNIKAEKLVREANDNFVYFRDYEMALEQVNEVLDIDPDHVKALILKGNIFFCIEENEKALECFEKSLSIDPYCAEAYGSKANTLDVLGKIKEAFIFCNKAFENATGKDRELLTSLFDQKLALLVKLRKYEEARLTLKDCYKQLNEEDGSYLASCYRDVIDTLSKERKRKKKTAGETLKLIHSV